MVPIHDTDIAQERCSQVEWENYELWEKVELRLRRQRRLWILATGIIFLVLSAVPIVLDRWPKWGTRAAARVLAQEINRIKREASIDRAAYHLKFVEGSGLNYTVERMPNCFVENGDIVRSGSLLKGVKNEYYAWVSTSTGIQLGVPGLIRGFCYDYLAGSGSVLKGEGDVGFGIIPARDLTEQRLDRLSILLLSGPSAEVSFE